MQVVALGVRDRAYENARGHEAVKLRAATFEVAKFEVAKFEVVRKPWQRQDAIPHV
jgi:hypothetical protein